MAIDIATEYPGKVDTSDPTNYPYGKARNVTAPGDGTGTPWVAPVLNDLIQLNYALLAAAGISPSGTADSVTTNQVFEAMQKLNGRQVFTAGGTFNTPLWAKRLKFTVVSGGGGGGNGIGGGGGGGGGSTELFYIDGPAPQYTIVVGAAGAGAVGYGGAGSPGGDSGVATTGGLVLVQGQGGEGGFNGPQGGTGGRVVSGSETPFRAISGGHGGVAFEVAGGSTYGGNGGASYFGPGPRGTSNAGQAATGFPGAGGAGAGEDPSDSGGNGAPGIVIVEWGIGI